MLPPGRKRLTLRIKPSVGRIRHGDNQNDRRNLQRNLSARVFLSIAASGLSGSRACGGWFCAGADRHPRIGTWSGGAPAATTVQETPTSRAASPCAGPCPPAVAAETLPAGGDQQHELRPSPAGRSAIPTARTPSDRCRRPPHRPNHHRAGAAAGCAAIPSVTPQHSPRGRRVSRAAAKRTTGAVDSRKPTIEPPTWPTFFTAALYKQGATSNVVGNRVDNLH